MCVMKSEHKICRTRPDCLFALLAATSRVTAIGASSTHECNSPLSVHGLQDESSAAATLAVVGCLIHHKLMQWLQELKPMTKDIAASHHGASGCKCHRQVELQFDNLSHRQLDRQDRSYARIT